MSKKAAEVLADVWTDHVIDNHPVAASFDQDNADATYPSEVWIRDHACTSQYMLQIQYTVVCKIPLLARALGLKAAARPSARATIEYIHNKKLT